MVDAQCHYGSAKPTKRMNIQQLFEQEKIRQQQDLCLIASENYASPAVLEATGSVFSNKYAEGYPGLRYYAGNTIVDEVERYTIQKAQEIFDTDYHCNVQPYAGSIANLAVYAAVLQPGDTILAMGLDQGGHLSHGHAVTLVGALYTIVHYGVEPETGLIDYDAVLALAETHRPKLIIAGGSAYPMMIDFARFAQIAGRVNALLMADIAHVAGLIAAKRYPTPFGHADIVTSTTQKTLRGPRGGIIFCIQALAKKIDKAVFPGVQGGPHVHAIAAKAVAFEEVLQPSFATYIDQLLANAQTLAYALQRLGIRLSADGTETHLMMLDLNGTGLRGKQAQELLESVGIITNMNTLPYDRHGAANPSGLRVGVAAATTRGMKEPQMQQIAELLVATLVGTPTESQLLDIERQVRMLTKRFRIPGY
jgi:glycine hydroxymethyltransferase